MECGDLGRALEGTARSLLIPHGHRSAIDQRDQTGGDLMNRKTMAGNGQLDMSPVEAAVVVLLKTCQQAVDELGGAVPPAQLRALLVIDRADGCLGLPQLAAGLAVSESGAGRLCDRMHDAGLVTHARNAENSREIVVHATGPGLRLAAWIRDRQRAALSTVLHSMHSEARDALVWGLGELAATEGLPRVSNRRGHGCGAAQPSQSRAAAVTSCAGGRSAGVRNRQSWRTTPSTMIASAPSWRMSSTGRSGR
jgi:DNA-binding MarR family transcriptional regulator